MFYVAYTADGIVNPAGRPVTFFYNGGPGSSTVWLRMASFGPKRVEIANATATAPAPYTLVDNEFSLLDKTDMVFVRRAPKDRLPANWSTAQRRKQFCNVDRDRTGVQTIRRTVHSAEQPLELPRSSCSDEDRTARRGRRFSCFP